MGALGVLWTTLLTGVCLQAARGANSLDNPCGLNKKMYHPYPGDPSRFIQCNKHGRMFVRHCNNGQRWDEYLNTCVKDRNVHPVQKVAQQAHTYNPQEPKDKVKQVYVETNYAASLKNQFQQGFSPLSYLYLMSGQPAYTFDTRTKGNGDHSAGSRYTSASDLSSYYRSGSNSPHRYQYSFIPGSLSNRRVMSTSYGTAGSTSYGNVQSNTYSNPKSSSSSTLYGTSDSSMRVISPQASYKSVHGKSRSVPLSFQQGTAGTLSSNSYVISPGSPAGTGYYSTSYSSGKSNTQASGSSASHVSSYNLPQGTGYSTAYGAAQGKTPSAVYSTSQGTGYGGTSYRAPQTNIYGLSHGSAQGTGSWYGNGKSATYDTGAGIGQGKSFSSTHGRAHGLSYGLAQGTAYAIPYKNGPNRYGSFQGTGFVNAAQSKTHTPQESSYGVTTYGSAKSTGYHTAYDRQQGQPHDTSSTSNSQHHGLQYAYPQGNQYGTHQPTPAKSVNFGHQVQGKSVHTHMQPQPAHHEQTLSTQCSGGKVRYFPDPNSQKHYYECQSHYKLARHSCEGNTVWVQPLRMCVNTQDRVSTAVPTVNPCAGTDALYKPYPTDPSKYIECRNWYSIVVWSCRPHQVWAQDQQRCVDMNVRQPIYTKPIVHTKPIEPKQYPPHQHKAKTGNSTCEYTTTFHEKYPQDPTKYIQCDESRKQFIRPCYSGGTWDDNIKVCTKNLGVEPETMPAFEYDFNRAKPLNMDDYDATYDTGASYQYASAHSGAKTYNYKPPASKCYEHQLWVPSLLKCVSLDSAVLDSENCHPGDYYFPEHHICASVKSTNIEPKSFPVGTHTYTDYNSYTGDDKQKYDSYMTDTSSKTASTNDHCSQYKPDPNDEGPCGMGEVAYYEFPHDAKCFIQCNQNNVMFIMPCGSHTYWNQQALTCVQDYLIEDPQTQDIHGSTMRASGKSLYGSGAGDSSLGDKQTSADHQFSNRCDDENSTSYKEHPENAHRFIMCTEHTGYSMWCPRHTFWRQDIQACFWPPSHADLN